ncbi:head protein, partial [Arcobacter sp. FW59]
MSFGGKTDKTNDKVIPGEGWPDLSTDEFRELRRVPFTFNSDSIEAAVTIAALNIQEKLESLSVDGLPPSMALAKTTL